MFNGTTKSESSANTGSNDKYSQIFTGGAYVTPLAFNPTIQQLMDLKGITTTKQLDEIVYKSEFTMNGEKKVMRRVHLYFSFNPKENYTKENAETFANVPVADIYYHRYEANLASAFIFNRDKSKIYCIDNKLNSGWLVVTPEEVTKFEKFADELKAAKKSGDDSEVIDKINKLTQKVCKATMSTTLRFTAERFDTKTVRPAREGEEPLMYLLFNMSNLKRATSPDGQYAADDKKAKITILDESGNKVVTNRYEIKKKEYENFDFDVTNIFDLLVSGQYDEVNNIVFGDSEYSKYFKGNKLGVMLGARRTDEGKVYQSVYNSGITSRGDSYVFRNDRKTTLIDGFTEYGLTSMSKNMVKNMTGEYGFKDNFQESFEFKPLAKEVFEEEDTKTPAKTDDLPF